MTTNKRLSSIPPVKRNILILVLVLLIGAGAGGYIYIRRASQRIATTTTAKPLQTAKATLGSIVLSASGTGTLMSTSESNLSFNTNGQVSKINVKIGDQVQAGQVLAELDNTDANIALANAQSAMDKLTSAAAVATAEQNLANAQANLITAKAALEQLISPEVLYWEERVAERQQALADAQAAAQTDSSAAAQQNVVTAQASLKYAEDSLSHFEQVYDQSYIQAAFTQYRTVPTRQHGTRDVVIKITDPDTGELIPLVYAPTEGEIGTARADYDLAKAAIAEAQTYLDVLNGASIPDGATGANLVTYIQTKDALTTAQYNLEATKLITPINGIVSAVSINVGSTVSAGTVVITVTNLDQPYQLDGYVNAKSWGKVEPGYNVEASFDAISDQVFKGTITNVYPTLDTSSSNTPLIHFQAVLNKVISYQLPAGASVSINVHGGSTDQAILVPIEALHEFGDHQYTVFVDQGGKLTLRVVQVGLMDLTRAQIVSGLKAGEIVTTGVVATK